MTSDDDNEPEAGDEAEASSAPISTRPTSPMEAIAIALGVTAAVAAVITWAFAPARAGELAMILAIGACYAVLTALTALRLRRRGELGALLRPASGDLTLGALSAGLLYGAAHLVTQTITARGTPREGWIMRLYLQLGDPEAHGRVLLGGAVFVVAALEEFVWRGLVTRAIEEVVGLRRAVVITALLFALAHLPTLFVLAMPPAGLNPLIVLAALGGGLLWGVIYARAGRLVPALFAHALFSWAVVEFPVWRP